MTEEQIKDYVSKNCCDLCDNRKWCSIKNECFVVNAITEATKELQEQSKRQSNNYKYDVNMLIESNNEVCEQLTKAKEIIKKLISENREVIAWCEIPQFKE